MAHWSERYVGKPFVNGRFDCADLACLIQKEVFNRDVSLPNERWYSSTRGTQRLYQMAKQMDHFEEYVQKVDRPQEGDIVLMRVLGRDMHIGTYCNINGEVWILHILEGQYSVLQRQNYLEVKGFRITGYYKPKV